MNSDLEMVCRLVLRVMAPKTKYQNFPKNVIERPEYFKICDLLSNGLCVGGKHWSTKVQKSLDQNGIITCPDIADWDDYVDSDDCICVKLPRDADLKFYDQIRPFGVLLDYLRQEHPNNREFFLYSIFFRDPKPKSDRQRLSDSIKEVIVWKRQEVKEKRLKQRQEVKDARLRIKDEKRLKRRQEKEEKRLANQKKQKKNWIKISSWCCFWFI